MAPESVRCTEKTTPCTPAASAVCLLPTSTLAAGAASPASAFARRTGREPARTAAIDVPLNVTSALPDGQLGAVGCHSGIRGGAA
ncbi:hypothetical protein [Kutzneria chonburiensis]|uniref:Secreted protein n=1 Tax=Kutzneria chonburiensis TaxID=1483604 RepID=A0ABV6N616_9PSEU